MSRTESEALQAGTVWWGGELFSGKPRWSTLLNYKLPKISKEEQDFLDGPVEEMCSMIDDWDITHNRGDMPPELWAFLKEHGFFSLIIPKQYGGKEFSALAHSKILTRAFAKSITVGSTIAVPNSLGPGELLLHYGTKEQKDYYLPRLAKGEDIPCFALTSPDAGSDASAMPDYGIVCEGEFEGKKVKGIRLNWNKRYITLAPVATVLGLAFKLFDPDHLIGDIKDIGITCALIPMSHPGVVAGRRHFPLNAVFQNGPTQGKDVFIPLDWIIGGVEMAGQGWRMLVECLSAGRSVSLPSSGVGGAKLATLSSGAYARIRRQFGTAIGNFEGIQEVLALIVGRTFQISSILRLTLGGIDLGERPSVLSGIVKYHCTEGGREAAGHAMDIHGGKGICLGPNNYLGRGYEGSPIGITVEGANILTRNMIIYGQGAIRCHPYVLKEMMAANMDDHKQALKEFDEALFGHLGFSLSNIFRSLFLAVSGGRFAKVPSGHFKHYYQQLSRFSASFALFSDSAMAVLGGSLKRKERLSARLGDILSYLYIASGVLKIFRDDGSPKDEEILVEWALEDLLYKIQESFNELLVNFPNRIVANILRALIFPWGQHFKKPNDKLDEKLAEIVMNPTKVRDRLIDGLYLGDKGNNASALLLKTLDACIAVEPTIRKVRKAVKAGELEGHNNDEYMASALKRNLITQTEFKAWEASEVLRKEVINVDDFDSDDLAHVMHKEQK